MVSFKSVFKTFVNTIINEMKNATSDSKFQWDKLCLLGAETVARKIQVKNNLEVKPEVTITGQSDAGAGAGAFVVSLHHERHEFWVEPTRFHYVRGYGKPKHLFKEFEELRKAFWKQQKEDLGKKEAVKDLTQLRISGVLDKKEEDARAEEALKLGQKKHKGAVKKKKEKKKAQRQERRRLKMEETIARAAAGAAGEATAGAAGEATAGAAGEATAGAAGDAGSAGAAGDAGAAGEAVK